ncbi:vWA domain-containing protein [Methylophilus sp. QUAN]|uniref:vWA domain-containing protein n=1 Tax=Methylophilus sp. QUAN TaxID=2781020 RepID=UPI00188EEFFC|nr:vWA domain-containing protein [Methylophilus sp. QUAN]MBF4991231.1 VWA domain-containing protein [Methylophilus sp. QUAN]
MWRHVVKPWVRHLVSGWSMAGNSQADWRKRCLILILLLLTLVLFKPHWRLPNRVYDWYFVVDITQSMNVPDYQVAGKSMSRLQMAKQSIRKTLSALPCGSQVALGMFTERNVVNVVEPVEVCSHFAALDQTVASMDWRMAWAADSFISHGVYHALEQAPQLGKQMRVMFFTDGQQAPPANPKYMPSYAGKPGDVQGYLVGMGKPTPSKIPKLDEKNAVAGYWEQEEVQRFGNFGMAETLSVLAMEQGQHDRNAGHGPGNALLENAHLSALDAQNLQRLANTTGLHFVRLDAAAQSSDWATGLGMTAWRWAETDLRPWLAWPACVAWGVYLALTFAGHPWSGAGWRAWAGVRQWGRALRRPGK